MAVNYASVLEKIRSSLSEDELARFSEDEDALPEAIREGWSNILCLGWDGDAPGLNGAHFVREWKGLYFFSSFDEEEQGPFGDVEDALGLEYFCFPTANPELTSDKLPLKRLVLLARNLVRDDGDTIWINGIEYVRIKGKIVRQ